MCDEQMFVDRPQNWDWRREDEDEEVTMDNGPDERTMSNQSSLDIEYYDLPTSLVATNIDDEVFQNDLLKKMFENTCCAFGENVTFQYFPSFKRIRINYETPEQVVEAHLALHKKEINGKIVKSYFIQPPRSVHVNPTLQPPKPTKQFLISPPASPPVGWEPITEAEPVVNYNILAAMANLAPGKEHELHAGCSITPSIVVLPCEDPPKKPTKMKIEQTQCPPRR
ncbi:calcipressin-2-like [Antedon mediterranea]|uniref:calcipressin-2-like n=1 Tax=Antedon mediterranea TaxID=105859 RepID=UPI003AF6C5D9